MNFCFDFLQELLMVWEAISNIRKGVSSDIQTPWSWLKKTRLRLVFSTTSRCLDIGWNTLPRVWYITSNIVSSLTLKSLWASNEVKKAHANNRHCSVLFTARAIAYYWANWISDHETRLTFQILTFANCHLHIRTPFLYDESIFFDWWFKVGKI